MTTRSDQLGHAQSSTAGSAGRTLLYTCPVGITTIVKSIYWDSDGGSTVAWVELTPVGAPLRKVLWANLLDGIPQRFDPMWLVLEAGDTLKFRFVTGPTTVSVIASGAELIA